MAGLTATISDLLGALSQSFRLSVYLPALVFVSGIAFTLAPYINQTAFYKAVTSTEWVAVGVLITVALGLAYMLSVLNVPLTQLYEGYVYRESKVGQFLTMLQYHRKKSLEAKAVKFNQQFDSWVNKFEVLRESLAQGGLGALEVWEAYGEYLNASSKRDRLNDELMRFYPSDETKILPTRLGNVFASFEDYPRAMYGMESVLLWPRMVPALIQSKYGELIEREKMGFDFFLNSSFLLFLFTFAYTALNLYMSAHLFLLVPIAALTGGWLCYRFAIMAAQNFGVTVRVAFDLHRNALRQSLGMKEPYSFDDETEQWQFLAKLLVGEEPAAQSWKAIFNYSAQVSTDTSDD